MVDNVYGVDDKDNSVTKGLIQVPKAFRHDHDYVFRNGGDRGKDNITKMQVEGYEFRFSVGGEHKAKTVAVGYLKEWKYPTERRVWGEFQTCSKMMLLKRISC